MLGLIVVAVAEPGKSKRMLRAPWSHGTPEDESLAFLQERLALLMKLLFWCFVALIAFLAIFYGVYRKPPADTEEVVPQHQGLVWATIAVGMTTQAILWRLVVLRRKLTMEQLYSIDAIFTIGANVVIALCAVLAFDRRQSAYTSLIYACWTVLTRALVVPSTGRRTAVVTALAMLPMGIAVAIITQLARWKIPDVPTAGVLVGYAQIATVSVLLAASGSRIIYGLRQKISAAQQLGQYTLGRKIGEGGMGAVYLAHHVMLRRPTAVKLLPPAKVGHDQLLRFEKEVQHMSELTHPNTVAVYDYGRSPDGVFYYAMEYLGGGVDLENLVRKHGRQPAERVRQILMQVCGALQEAHDRGIVHRDIKPANIILCERGAMFDVAKVVDFGLVKEISPDGGGASTQIILGTPAYIAPESVTDPSTIGAPADLYSLGAVGYYLLAGRRVFEGAAVDLCIQHVTTAPQPLSALGVELPAELEAIIMQCLAKKPVERPASAQELSELLRAVGTLPDWDEARASAWWSEFRPDASLDTSPTPTVTMTVDYVHREDSA
jgi:serine/threonine-protein kinase